MATGVHDIRLEPLSFYTAMLTVTPIPALRDNYIWLIQKGRFAAIVDPGEAGPVFDVIKERSLQPVAILVTHHHWDHVSGIRELLEVHPVPVYGPRRESIPGRSRSLSQGDTVHLPRLDIRFEIYDVPGHTAGAIAYHGEDSLFSGDTLFTAGCGRLFEGTAAQMHASLTKLCSLPPATRLYCGHEYTLANLAFASAVEPDNAEIGARTRAARERRVDGLPTVPSALALERQTNPFLRCHLPSVRAAAERHCGRGLSSAAEVFGAIRSWKDSF